MGKAHILLVTAVSLVGIGVQGAAKSPGIDFNREIRPILSDNCFACHGPDDKERKARLRFDLKEEALQPAKSGDYAIVPGKPAESELILRVLAYGRPYAGRTSSWPRFEITITSPTSKG